MGGMLHRDDHTHAHKHNNSHYAKIEQLEPGLSLSVHPVCPQTIMKHTEHPVAAAGCTSSDAGAQWNVWHGGWLGCDDGGSGSSRVHTHKRTHTHFAMSAPYSVRVCPGLAVRNARRTQVRTVHKTMICTHTAVHSVRARVFFCTCTRVAPFCVAHVDDVLLCERI
jgi:hypothetical protein